MSDSIPTNFITKIIDADLSSGKRSEVVTRFPPEPNGYLHIGHAKAICINFGIAASYPKAKCFLRFDDTNPEKEEAVYAEAIQENIKWLGFGWGANLRHTSDYYQRIYEAAVHLIKAGKAFVCSLSAEDMRAYRGTLTEAGKESPDRNRSIEENLDLFERMKQGEFADGSYTLRAKIDMSSGNINLRDPAIYRIRKKSHHRTGDAWCIYPMYDFAHALSDAIEGTTHSLCSLEFQDHRPLYNWCVENCEMENHPQQIEFSRLNLNYTITSKRKLKSLVDEGSVSGWDDPRMPTLSGVRRRGFPAAAIRNFCQMLGASKQNSIIDMSVLENCVRDELNNTAERRMAVLRPLKVTITNYPEGEEETLSVANHPKMPEKGRRNLAFGSEVYIDQSDFMEEPVPKYFRLAPGREVRLMNAYVIHCDEVLKDDAGNMVELKCHYLPETLGGKKPDHGKKVKGVVQWVSVKHGINAEVRLYDRLFNEENPAALEDFHAALNPESLEVITDAKVEPCLAQSLPEAVFQFNRVGYFSADMLEHSKDKLVFNRAVSLRDTWSS